MIDISKALQIEGWMSFNELTWLAQQAKQSSRILEVGSYKGRSARALADNTAGVVYCIDPWEPVYYNDDSSINTDIHPDVLTEFIHNLEDVISHVKVIPHKQKFSEFYTTIKFDMIFLDGDHRYRELKYDIEHALAILQPNGLLCGHDYNMPGLPSVKRAVDELLSPVDSIDYIWYKRIP